MRTFKKDSERQIRYVALEFTSALVDLTLKVRRPDGSLFEFESAVTEKLLVEVADGVYKVEYTPDELGVWTELITSATNHDKAVSAYRVIETDLEDISSKVDGVETKVDAVKTDTESIDGKVDALDGKVDTVKADTEDIISAIDDLDGQIKPGGYFIN